MDMNGVRERSKFRAGGAIVLKEQLMNYIVERMEISSRLMWVSLRALEKRIFVSARSSESEKRDIFWEILRLYRRFQPK